jgi:tetratricopeptide (TPR) repeat protein
MLREAGRGLDAETSLSDAVALAQSLLKRNADDANSRYYLAAARCEQGLIFIEVKNDHKAAEKIFDDAVRDLTALTAGDPEIVFFRPKLAEARSHRGLAHIHLGRHSDADADFGEARKILEATLSRTPRDMDASRLLAQTLERLARVASIRGDKVEAGRLLDLAIDRQRPVVDAFPENQREHRMLAFYRDERRGLGN